MLEFIVALLVVLLLARLTGEAFRRLHQAPLIGEVLVGILLGPSVLAWIDPSPADPTGAAIGVVATLGILFLVLTAGIEVGREGLRQAFREGTAIVAAVEFAFPFALGYLLGSGLGLPLLTSLFLATGMAVTALPVSVRILMDLELLTTKLGRAIVSVAMANDVLAFSLLAVLLALAGAVGSPVPVNDIALGIAKVFAFVGFVYCVGWLLRQREPSGRGGRPWLAVLVSKLRSPEAGFATVLVAALGMGVVAEGLGLHFAIGVFYAGIFLTRETLGEGHFLLMRNTTMAVGMGFLAPVFFAYVGLKVSFAVTDWTLVLLVTSVAFVGKVWGGVMGGYAAGFRGRVLAALGVGLNARGMMELLLAEVGLAAGIIGQDLYAAIVIMTLVTTLAAPLLVKALIKGQALE